MKSRQLNASISTPIYAKLEELAKQERRSISNYVAMVLLDHIANVEGNAQDKPPLPHPSELFKSSGD